MTTVFNKNDYNNNNNTGYDDDDSMYINRNGDVMNGSLSMPYIVLTSSENPIHFLDGTYQNTAFNETNEIIVNMQSDISGCIFATENVKTKTTNISYSGSLLNKTTISNNCFITNLECGNINTSHLSGTTSNLQTQINSIASNNITATSTFTNTPITINNSNFDTTIAKYDQPNYEDLKFHNAITLQAISTDRIFFIGSLSDASNGSVAQFMIGTNAGGDPDPDILMSLSCDAVYFFGVRQPLVPVGTIQIYAGTESPNGYLISRKSNI